MRRLTTTFADGSNSFVEQRLDGTATATYADGTRITTTLGPVPRWGMQAPLVVNQTLTTPGGRTEITTHTRSVTLGNQIDPLSLMTLTDTLRWTAVPPSAATMRRRESSRPPHRG